MPLNGNEEVLKKICLPEPGFGFAASLITGTQLLEVSKMMGHSSPNITLTVYFQWAVNEKSNSQIALANRILGAAEEEEERGEAETSDSRVILKMGTFFHHHNQQPSPTPLKELESPQKEW